MPGRLRDPGRDVVGRLQEEPTDAAAYDSWTLVELRARAAELRITGRSRMRRADVVAALRARSDEQVRG